MTLSEPFSPSEPAPPESLHVPAARPGAGPLRDPVALLALQLRAVDAWHAALHDTERAATAEGLSREARLDAGRRLDVRRREQDVIRERAEGAGQDLGPLVGRVPVRAVVAHRHAWTRDALAARLGDAGVEVLLSCDSGADAVGAAVAEQPDVVVVDETLAMRSGAEVVAELARFCPHTLVGGYVNDDAAVGRLLDAGAGLVFTRRIPPAEVVDRLLGLVQA